jgi:hypothetical protein
MKRKLIYMLGFLVILVSCYPQGPEYYEEMDVVYTNYDESFDFTSQRTYSMPEKIVKITGNIIQGENPEFVKEPYNTQILDQIQSLMSELGWTRAEDPQQADVLLIPVSWKNTTVYYWYDYWCWWYPYYCGWGWYYPSYPVSSSVTSGTLVMSLVADGDEYIEPSVVWTSAINGLLSGSYDVSRINRAIDQAFEQSPYLNIK